MWRRFLRFNPDGSLAGSQKATRSIALSSDGNSLTATITGQVHNPADAVAQPICGTEVGTPM